VAIKKYKRMKELSRKTIIQTKIHFYGQTKTNRCNFQQNRNYSKRNPAISFCCTGKYISSGGYYFRHIKPDVKIEINDLDNLRIEEYDKMCGEERLYHTTKQLTFIRDNFPNILSIRKKPDKKKKDAKQLPNNEKM
jgi:hypothetical protein